MSPSRTKSSAVADQMPSLCVMTKPIARLPEAHETDITADVSVAKLHAELLSQQLSCLSSALKHSCDHQKH